MNDTKDEKEFMMFATVAAIKTADNLEQRIYKLEKENAELRNKIVILNNHTNWVCVCGGTDCAGKRENAALRAALERIVELSDMSPEITKEAAIAIDALTQKEI